MQSNFRKTAFVLSALLCLSFFSCGTSEIGIDIDGSEVEPDLIREGFVLIPAGSFTMGSPRNESERSNEEQHEVTITRSFYAQIHEVTQGEWETLMGNNPSYFSSSGNGVDCGSDCPVENVTWYESLAYANALSASEDLQECYVLSGCENSPGNDMECTDVSWNSDCLGYRLPTEAEWEYVARAGTTTAYYNGNDPDQLGDIAWYEDNSSSTTHPVAQLEANSWGFYDMIGNVWEWCWDGYEPNYSLLSVTDPTGLNTSFYRVNRGGSWLIPASLARSASRQSIAPKTRYRGLGFRLVSSAP